MMDVGLHHHSVHAQLTPTGQLFAYRYAQNTLIEGLQRLGLDKLCPFTQGSVIGDGMKVHATKLSQHQTVSHLHFRLGVAEIV
jgi:hypothetical protein